MNILKISIFITILLFTMLLLTCGNEKTSKEDSDILNETALLVGKGIAFARNGMYDSAKAVYSEAIAMDSQFADAYSNRAAVYAALGEIDSAINDFSTAITLDSQRADNYANRGGLYFRLGDYQKTLADCDRSIQYDFANPSAYINRGAAYAELGQFQQALEDYNSAIEIDSLNPAVYVNRGLFYMVKMGDKDKACEDWKKACDLGRCKNYELAKKNGDCP
jgi:tetratricopeptide (TPR) repeat protein